LLLGDWNGARTNLLNQGIDFQFKYTNEIAYNATGGIRSEATYADQYTAGVTLDLDRLFGVHDAQFQATVTERTGRNLTDDAQLGTLQHRSGGVRTVADRAAHTILVRSEIFRRPCRLERPIRPIAIQNALR